MVKCNGKKPRSTIYTFSLCFKMFQSDVLLMCLGKQFHATSPECEKSTSPSD